jgi:uncharacterized protein YcbK (DUF882 family)
LALRFRSWRVAVCVAILTAVIGSSGITAPSREPRTLALYNIHTKETVSVVYKKDGNYVPAAMEQINWILRDWRKDESTKIDPELIDLIWEIHTELGSKEPVHIISGYRSRDTNEMLRRTVGGQASQSRHILGKAADVHFPDIPLKQLRYSALIRERGGVGYYPTSAIPFVHIDTDRVRHWPRLPRYELALLFPNGKTQHQPAEGGPITIEDVRVAKARHSELAQQIAEFHEFRRQVKTPTLLASADTTRASAQSARAAEQTVATLAPRLAEEPMADPHLIEPPRRLDRPTPHTIRPSDADRAQLASLAAEAAAPRLISGPTLVTHRTPSSAALPSLTGYIPAAGLVGRTNASRLPHLAAFDGSAVSGTSPRLANGMTSGWSTGWVQAPAYDEEHPEELSYRPFPIAPLLTLTASADDAALTRLVRPDVARTLDLLNQAGDVPPMRLRPGRQLAQLMWAQQFKGEAVNLTSLIDGEPSPPATAGLSSRKVKTTQR